ncbi:MAG: tRNA pseudouridine(55) synthase TruB [Candidatus Yanofskybacteria bacterium]|nr:tRNA pseudouridine(55) synthase TruB [Candidatus Yanofskybacteria bacterium]
MKKLKCGIYNIYKPAGPTSHDIVNQIRKLSGEQRVGHAGTLDPFAEGVLIVAVGREYTKKLGQFLKMDKTYKATIKLGAESDTGDLTGHIKQIESQGISGGKSAIHLPENSRATSRGSKVGGIADLPKVREVLKKFTGEIIQTPPLFSAVKIKGRKAYELARRGITPELKPRKVKIYSIKILKYKWPYLEIETKVSSGTYIRSLAHDLGKVLKTGGYLEKLIRTGIGRYNIRKSVRLDSLSKK